MLYEELSLLIGSELADPDLAFVQVTDVRISRDLRSARIYVHHSDDEVSERDVLRALKRAIPYIRSQIAERNTTRAVPELTFQYDDTPERAQRIDALLSQIAEERAESQPSDEKMGDGETAEETP
jgi:ribosome-binding factor A